MAQRAYKTPGCYYTLLTLLALCTLLLGACQQKQPYPGTKAHLALTFHPTYEVPFTQVKINGEAMDAYIDLGGNFDGVLPKEDLLRLHAAPCYRTISFCGLSGTTLKAAQYKGVIQMGNLRPELSLLDEYKDWSLTIGDCWDTLHMKPVYVGLGILRRYNVLLDLANNSMDLFPPHQATPPPTGQLWQATTGFMTSNGLEMPLRVKGAFIRAVVDTGSSRSCLIQPHPLLPLTTDGMLPDGTPEVLLTDTKAGDMSIDPLMLLAPPIKTGPPIHVLLGCDFLKRYKLYIDFKNEKIWLQDAT